MTDRTLGSNSTDYSETNTCGSRWRRGRQDWPLDNPRFIQTVPKRGYRFIAPVAEIAEETTPENLETTRFRHYRRPRFRHTGKRSARPQDSPSGHRAGRWYWRRWLAPALCGLAILAAVFYMVRIRPRHAPGDNARSMLVVLPFQNLSGDPAQEYFSDGLTEETITDLGQLSPVHLGVIARTSSMAYKHTEKTIGQIGRELHAAPAQDPLAVAEPPFGISTALIIAAGRARHAGVLALIAIAVSAHFRRRCCRAGERNSRPVGQYRRQRRVCGAKPGGQHIVGGDRRAARRRGCRSSMYRRASAAIASAAGADWLP